jgi:hypothetical protein
MNSSGVTPERHAAVGVGGEELRDVLVAVRISSGRPAFAHRPIDVVVDDVSTAGDPPCPVASLVAPEAEDQGLACERRAGRPSPEPSACVTVCDHTVERCGRRTVTYSVT